MAKSVDLDEMAHYEKYAKILIRSTRLKGLTVSQWHNHFPAPKSRGQFILALLSKSDSVGASALYLLNE